MAITNIVIGQVGTSGVIPQIIYLTTTDTEATVLTAGYLNQSVNQGFGLVPGQMALVSTMASASAEPTAGWFNVSYTSPNWSLTAITSPGNVTLPTVATRLVHASDTVGTLTTAAAAVYNAGDISAGTNAIAGALLTYSSQTSKGALKLSATANSGNTVTTITNAAMGQATVLTIPDPASATGNVAVAAAALVSGNLISASGTAGLIADGGIATTNVQLKTQVKAQQVTGLGGSGAGPLTVTATGCLSTSVVVVSILASSNACSVSKVVPGSGSFALTVSADPGATLSIQYIMYIAAQ